MTSNNQYSHNTIYTRACVEYIQEIKTLETYIQLNEDFEKYPSD